MSNKMWCGDDDDDNEPAGLPYAEADLSYLDQLNQHDNLQQNYGIETPEPELQYPEKPLFD